MVNSFEFISGSTHLRPRDFIRYIQVCAEDTLTQGYKQIHPKTIKFVDKAFSNYLRDEIVDEIHALLPDINNILQIISQIRKQTFTVTEFKEVYRSYLDAGTIKEKILNTFCKLYMILVYLEISLNKKIIKSLDILIGKLE